MFTFHHNTSPPNGFDAHDTWHVHWQGPPPLLRPRFGAALHKMFTFHHNTSPPNGFDAHHTWHVHWQGPPPLLRPRFRDALHKMFTFHHNNSRDLKINLIIRSNEL